LHLKHPVACSNAFMSNRRSIIVSNCRQVNPATPSPSHQD
jgi:hypothetical protein